MSASETGWLIEEPFGPHIHWIALEPTVRLRHLRVKRTQPMGGRYEADEYETPVRRVKDANEALRFARKADAEAFIALLDRFLLNATATEHEWPAQGGEARQGGDSAASSVHERPVTK